MHLGKGCALGHSVNQSSEAAPEPLQRSGVARWSIATKGEVCEKRTSVAPAHLRAQSRAQPARVNEATTGKRGQDRKRPYEARKP